MSRELNNDLDFPEVTSLTRDDRIPLSQGGRPFHVKPNKLGRLPLVTPGYTFYVATTGNDLTGDGSQSSPWATLQYAYDWIGSNTFVAIADSELGNDNPTYVTIQIADGTYAGVHHYRNPFFNGLVYFHGNAANPQNVIINAPASGEPAFGFYDAQASAFCINNLTIAGGGASAQGVSAVYPTVNVWIGCDPITYASGTVRLTGRFSQAFSAGFGGSFEAYGNLVVASVTGSWSYLFAGGECGQPYVWLDNITIPTMTFNSVFLLDTLSYGVFKTAASSYGTITGKAYDVRANSVLNEVNTIPGGTAGTTQTGGQVL